MVTQSVEETLKELLRRIAEGGDLFEKLDKKTRAAYNTSLNRALRAWPDTERAATGAFSGKKERPKGRQVSLRAVAELIRQVGGSDYQLFVEPFVLKKNER